MIRASCLCGDVAWEAEAPLELPHHCHCSLCRKAHGTAFGTWGSAKAESFRWLRGSERIRAYESSPGFFRRFCGRCGSVVAGEPQDGKVFMPLGCLDDDPGSRPLAHIFVASKAPWHEISDDLPRFDAFPPGLDAPELHELPRPAAAAGHIGGSCLCGGVAYEVAGRIEYIHNCHCSRCRKAHSAAHASNGFIGLDAFRFTRGEDVLDSYRIPEAKRFTNVFCRVCGSILPQIQRERGLVVVPAGSLDDDPGGRARCHIFVASKAPWHEISDDLPQHAEGLPEA